MTDKPMIDSEAVTAGRIAQSVDRAIEKSTCPLCGADYAMDTPYKVRFTCGTFMSPLRKQFDSERGDVQSKACRLRRQLAQAQEQLQQALAREAELRRVVERVQHVWMWFHPDQRPFEDEGMFRRRYYKFYELGEVLDAALSSAPAAPPAAQGGD